MYPDFPFAEISGSPFDRGKQHGRHFADRVRKSAGHYLAQLREVGCDDRNTKALVRDYLPTIEDFDASYIAEMRGIAAGSGVAFEEVVLVNARTEILQLAGRQVREVRTTPLDPDGCTGAVILPDATANGRLIHALNWDWKSVCVETAVVLRIRREDGPDILTFTEAGSLARAGLNSIGVAITANYIESDRDQAQSGVPLAIIRRKILECDAFALAIRTAAFTPKSTSNNLMLSHADGFAIDFECAPDEAFALYPQDGLLVHANHWTSPVALTKLRDRGLANTPESVYRDWRVREILQRDVGRITTDHVKAAMADDFGAPWSVCRPPRPSLFGNLSATVATLVMDPSAGTMEVSPMPAIERRFTRYTIAPDLAGTAGALQSADCTS